MIGSSRTSLATVQEAVNAKYTDPAAEKAGQDLLEVADLLVRERQLLDTLSDSGRSARDRQEVVSNLLGDKISPLALDLSTTIATQRWSSDSDLVDAFESAGAQCLFGAREAQGDLDRVEEELFRFGRILDSNGDLQLALSSPAIPAETKRGILSDLLSSQATATTVDLIAYMCGHLRGRRIEQALSMLTTLAAERRGKLLAVVRAARPLTSEQNDRLEGALQRIYGRPVATNVEIDPSILGGLTVQIGEDVIDGSIANRLETARRRVTG